MPSLTSALVSGPAAITALTGLVVLYVTSLVIYRRFFHPLAKVPGPFLASVTALYQTYYNRRYFEQIEKLHEQYGPVVRIMPDEVHLSDSKNFEKIYYVGSKYSKAKNFYNSLMVPYSAFGTLSNDVHKIRRSKINPFFSRKMVLEMETVVQSKALKLMNRISKCMESGQAVDLHHLFRGISIDVITDYAYDISYDILDLPDSGEKFFRDIRGIGPVFWTFQLFPTLRELAYATPPSIAKHMGPALASVTALQQDGVKKLISINAAMKAGTFSAVRPTIFSELLDPAKQGGYPVPPISQLKDETYSQVAAAADTTGHAMEMAAYGVLKNPAILAKLREELYAAFPEPNSQLSFIKLEKLPYLTGVVKEGIRLSFGVPGRLPRVVPEGGETFNGCFLPEGTVVSMSSWIMQRNPEVFPDPMKFDPERWVDPVQYRKLDANMMAFGGGSRICVGMPLAYCEVYVTIGTLFHRFSNLEIYKTTDRDMEWDDFFSSYPIEGRNWLKAVEKGSLNGKA